MKRRVVAMYSEVVLKDGRIGAVVSRDFDKKISDDVAYTVELFPPTEGECVIRAHKDDFASVKEWEEVEEDKITEY